MGLQQIMHLRQIILISQTFTFGLWGWSQWFNHNCDVSFSKSRDTLSNYGFLISVLPLQDGHVLAKDYSPL